MSVEDAELARIYAALAPWSVLVAGTLITCCATRNHSALKIIAAPVQLRGQIAPASRAAQISMPTWYPLQEAIIETAGGEIYTKLKEVPVLLKGTPPERDTIQVHIDLSKEPLLPTTNTFTLTYSPWFRFVTDPVGFDIVGRIAHYVGDCFAFLCARNGIEAQTIPRTDGCDLVTATGLRVELHGMDVLTRIRLLADDVETSFDLEKYSFEIDQRMFPDAFEAGVAILKTGDRLQHMTVAHNGHRVRLSDAENAHV